MNRAARVTSAPAAIAVVRDLCEDLGEERDVMLTGLMIAGPLRRYKSALMSVRYSLLGVVGQVLHRNRVWVWYLHEPAYKPFAIACPVYSVLGETTQEEAEAKMDAALEALGWTLMGPLGMAEMEDL